MSIKDGSQKRKENFKEDTRRGWGAGRRRDGKGSGQHDTKQGCMSTCPPRFTITKLLAGTALALLGTDLV
jgi:hypothetical protein